LANVDVSAMVLLEVLSMFIAVVDLVCLWVDSYFPSGTMCESITKLLAKGTNSIVLIVGEANSSKTQSLNAILRCAPENLKYDRPPSMFTSYYRKGVVNKHVWFLVCALIGWLFRFISSSLFIIVLLLYYLLLFVYVHMWYSFNF
jgi:hypothetical protein